MWHSSQRVKRVSLCTLQKHKWMQSKRIQSLLRQTQARIHKNLALNSPSHLCSRGSLSLRMLFRKSKPSVREMFLIIKTKRQSLRWWKAPRLDSRLIMKIVTTSTPQQTNVNLLKTWAISKRLARVTKILRAQIIRSQIKKLVPRRNFHISGRKKKVLRGK